MDYALAAAVLPPGGDAQLAIAAILGIAVVVVLITALKVHPFLALIFGSAVLGIVTGLAPSKIVDSFTTGVGSTVGSVGLLIALGAMIGGLLADSGAADNLVETVASRVHGAVLPWTMALVAALVGLPLFFEVGVVLLVPIVLLVARRVDVPLMRIGIPALAGLSVLHGLVPPHPGPLVAISALKADLGLTLAYGLIIAIPTVIIAGPLFSFLAARWVPVSAPGSVLGRAASGASSTSTVAAESSSGTGSVAGAPRPPIGEARVAARAEPAVSREEAAWSGDRGPDERRRFQRRASDRRGVERRLSPGPGAALGYADEDTQRFRPLRRRPGIAPTIGVMLLPIVLMLLRAFGELFLSAGSPIRSTTDVIGAPVVALLAGVVAAMLVLGRPAGMGQRQLSDSVGAALPPIAGILLIVAAGGGFKQVLVDGGVGDMVARTAGHVALSPLILGWLVAVGIRLATGSATVATITAAGIVAPLAVNMDKPGVALLALAVGCGSLFFSHVNDAGFWLVKEYFGLTVPETLKTWSVMETVISVVGLVGVLALRAVV